MKDLQAKQMEQTRIATLQTSVANVAEGMVKLARRLAELRNRLLGASPASVQETTAPPTNGGEIDTLQYSLEEITVLLIACQSEAEQLEKL